MSAANRTTFAIYVMVMIAGLFGVGFILHLGERSALQEAEQQAASETRAASAPGGGGGAGAAEPGQGGGGLRVARVEGALPEDDPFAAAWNGSPAKEVALYPQNMAMPTLDSPSVSRVTVRALTDGQRIAWCIRWKDETKNMNVDSGRFCDAVAIQFPVDPAAAFTMGARGAKVQILHWKGVWQKDIDEHFQDVQDLHPNYWADLYWFAEPAERMAGQKLRYRVPESFSSEAAQQYLVAHTAGNPVSQFHRKQPVEELVAEGFGTLTTQERSSSSGRGVWKDGRWGVVFARPLSTNDELDYQFEPGGKSKFAVAVWEGGSGNVGGRKHWSSWTPFKVSP